MLQRAQPFVDRTEDEERGQRRAQAEQSEAEPCQRRTKLSQRDRHGRRVQRDGDDTDLAFAGHDRRILRGESRSAAPAEWRSAPPEWREVFRLDRWR